MKYLTFGAGRDSLLRAIERMKEHEKGRYAVVHKESGRVYFRAHTAEEAEQVL